MDRLDDDFVESTHRLARLALENPINKTLESDVMPEDGPSDENMRNLDPDQDSLDDQIWRIIKNNPIGLNPEGTYFPDDEYDTLFTRDAIQSALGDDDTHLPLVDYVLENAKKIFAILLLVFSSFEDRRKALYALRTNKFTDSKLPLETDAVCSCQWLGQPCGHSFPHHNPWSAHKLETFKEKQYHFLVLKFESETFIYEVSMKHFLPFTRKVPAGDVPSGCFSEVTRVEMLASKQDRVTKPTRKTIVVALKTLKRINLDDYKIDVEWQREAKAHKQLNGKRDHIIQAFAAYKQKARDPQNDVYHLVLEWADGGSLYDFWTRNPAPQINHLDVKKSRQTVMKMLEQLYGLADALDGMHYRSSSPEQSRGGSGRSSAALLPEMGEQRRGSLDIDVPSRGDLSLPTFNIDPADDTTSDIGSLSTVFPPDPTSPDTISQFDFSLTRRSSFNLENWRHGDIKPENILRFIDGKEDASLGKLKLADLGRAQQHLFVTRMRETKEKELWRTRWYEPPDLEELNHKKADWKISRLFDIWSMGCVIFEAVLWLLYGYDFVTAFLDANELTPGEQSATPYWRRERSKYQVSDAATRWMNHILEHDPESEGAIGSLVLLVRDRLLKIDLPPNSDVYVEGRRTNAKDLMKQLQIIIERAKRDEKYLYSGADRTNVSSPKQFKRNKNASPQSTGRSLSPSDAARMVSPVSRGQGTAIARSRVYTNSMENKWKTPADGDFVNSNLANCQFCSDIPDLCQFCKDINILGPRISFKTSMMKKHSDGGDCDLCELVLTAAKHLNLTNHSNVSLIRSGDSYVVEGINQKVLRLCYKESSTEQDAQIPLSAPGLETPGSNDPSVSSLDSFIKLPKAWLKDCDANHGDLCASMRSNQVLPKRLIKVENPKKPKIIMTADLALNPADTNYIALSHKWGSMPHGAMTTKSNIEQRKKRIPIDELPLSFKNAITITKALKCPYLWIDSLCILQGPDGDFDEQADKMRTTFSGAYCVLAACSAESATVGFLQRQDSLYIKMGEIFVSKVTNDFERDVLQSPLHRRGWVLQERALARRTIFFTNTQMYWECGDGIRCETLVKLQNDKNAFLGDANFPAYTIRPTTTVGEQIDLFIDLFQRYTSLEFSHPEDRPFAIDGLMERLTEAFKTRSLAGLFKTFWGRCLLWRRAEGAKSLQKIPFGTHTRKIPPTWSWMAYDGVVSFIKPDGGQVDWKDDEIILPFANRTQASWLNTSHRTESVAIQAKAFDFKLAEDALESEAFIYYDNSKVPPTAASMKCVVIGSEKQQTGRADTKLQYVLIVKATPHIPETRAYERVGVGCLLGKFILWDTPVSVTIE